VTRRIVHLSDIHFGRAKAELVEPLASAINALAPDLAVISGDLTQRARHTQFRAARAFVDRLDPPVLCVPGNHDTPLDNPFMRAASPWSRWRRWMGEDLEPRWADEEMAVIGVNTVNRWAIQSGRIGAGTRRRMAAAMTEALGDAPDGAPGRIGVIVAHHPLEHEPGERKRRTRGAGTAIDAMAAAGVDIVLTGHLHAWRAEPLSRGGAIQVQAGTALSTRQRGEENDFNLLTLDPDTIVVERYVAEGRVFLPGRRAVFVRGGEGWRSVES